MASTQLLGCFPPGQGSLDRVNYFQGQLIMADDMVLEQTYFRQKLRRHNRFLHGWGVVCGLGVSASPRQDAPWRVRIDGGYALGPSGDEVYVPETVFLDLAQCGPGATTDPCAPARLRRHESSGAGEPVFVAIKYEECVARPIRVMPAGCACDETACEYSRIRDSFEVACLTELPNSHQPSPAGPSLCDIVSGQQLAPCLPCPPDDWVVLAQINLPASPATDIATAQINNLVRRQLHSTAVLQDMLIACCCEVEQADLAVTKSVASHERSDDGEEHTITYVIHVVNNGPTTARNITVTDTLAVVDGSITNIFGFTASTGAWTETQFTAGSPQAELAAEIPELGAQSMAVFAYGAEIRGQTITNAAEAHSGTPDPNSANNSDVVTITGFDVVNPNR